jgi:hypothetical protein
MMVRSEGYSTERQRIITFGNMRMPTHKLSQASALIHVLSGDDGFTTKLLENGVSYRWNRHETLGLIDNFRNRTSL